MLPEGRRRRWIDSIESEGKKETANKKKIFIYEDLMSLRKRRKGIRGVISVGSRNLRLDQRG